MGYVVLTILMNLGIFLSFRSFRSWHIPTFPAIVVNYYVCVLTGIIFTSGAYVRELELQPWMIFACILGLFFIGTFYLMARTTQLMGLSVATVASKMSLAIPVLYNLIFRPDIREIMGGWQYLGIGISIFAIFFTSLRTQTRQTTTPQVHARWWLLPFSIFALGGIIDTSLNLVNQVYLSTQDQRIFPVLIFLFAGITGTIALFFTRQKFTLRTVIGGIYLGVPNYFSVYFLLKALSEMNNNGALVFPLVNIGIITLSSLLGISLFRERLSSLNWLGMALAVVAIILLAR